jgi:hypothetical protein
MAPAMAKVREGESPSPAREARALPKMGHAGAGNKKPDSVSYPAL